MIKCLFILAIVIAGAVGAAADQVKRTVIYDDVATEVAVGPDLSADLWITTDDLLRATRFVIKPQGVCRDELCFPLPKSRKAEFVSKKGGKTWFNLSEFAKLIRQPVVADQKNGVWYFGARDAEQNGYLTSLEAPNFTLPDLNGKPHSLTDFRGKKVLLVTWASW
jgi:AhpC/TSA family